MDREFQADRETAYDRFGLVTLSNQVREKPALPKVSSCRGCLAPRAHRHGAKRAMRLSRGQMALDVEGVVDGGMDREESLRRAGALEALHLALPPPRRLMRILDAIVFPSPTLMAALDPQIADRCAV
jgi:hypothetical protein